MDKKVYRSTGLEFKQEGDQGLVTAVFATLNVIDEDGDVTIPGAFGEQSVKLAAWGHGWDKLPVGRGAIRRRATRRSSTVSSSWIRSRAASTSRRSSIWPSCRNGATASRFWRGQIGRA